MSASALRAVANEVQRLVDAGVIVGGELLVVKNRKTVLHRAFGLRDREERLPWRTNTICNVRSMTKSLTTVAVRILVEEGKVGLDDPACRYVPAFDNEKGRAVTVRHLITHRSGLPLTVLTGTNQHKDLQALAEAAGNRGPDFEPGSRFRYSDAGMEVAAAIVETVSGTTVDRFVSERILAPLGMADSVYPPGLPAVAADRVASLYIGRYGNWSRGWKVSDRPLYPFAWGSQTLYTTCADYARFLGMMLGKGTSGGRTVLSPQSVAEMLEPVSPMSQLGADEPMPTMFPGHTVHYGQGMVLHATAAPSSATRVTTIGHSGSDGTVGWAWPDRDLIVCFFAQTRGQASVVTMEDAIDRHLLHPRADGHPPSNVRGLLGTYYASFAHYRGAPFRVLWRDGALALDVPDQIVFRLKEPDANGQRAFAMTDQVSISFTTRAGGKATGLRLHQGPETYDLPRTKPTPDPPLRLADVRRYLGTYSRPEDDGTVEVAFENGNLVLKVAETPVPLALDRVGPETWRLRVAPTTIVFRLNETGEVTSFTSKTPDGKELVRPRATTQRR